MIPLSCFVPRAFASCLIGLLACLPAQAQNPPASLLGPPSLPSTLPGGGALQSLPPSAQQDILQRLMDASAGRPLGSPMPSGPQPTPFAGPGFPTSALPIPLAAPEEPLSPIEQFFDNRRPQPNPGAVPIPPGRIPLAPQPLRQFGYDSFRTNPPGALAGQAFGQQLNQASGAIPEDYIIGRDDELVISLRGRSNQDLTLRVSREGMLLLPNLAPMAAADRTLRELREELSRRAQRELAGSEVFISVRQMRQVTIFVGGEVQRPGVVALSPLANVFDALVAAQGLRKSGTLRAIRVEGPRGRRVVDLYPVLAGEGEPPDLSLREGERILVPPIGGVVALGGEVSRPAIYELPPGSGAAPLGTMLRLAGDALRPSGNRFLLETTDGEGRRAFREINLQSPLRRGDLLLVEPGTDVQAQNLRLTGHVAQPLTRALGGRGASLRGLLGDGRIVRPDPYGRMAVILRTDPRTRGRRFQPFDLAALLGGRADVPLAEGDEVIILALSDITWLSSPSVQWALLDETERGRLNAAQARATAPAPAAASGMLAGLPGLAPAPAAGMPSPPGMAAEAPPKGLECAALTQLEIAARSSAQRFAHARMGSFRRLGEAPCPQVFQDYPALLTFLLDNAVTLTGEARLPGLYPITNGTGLDALLAVAGGLTDTADLSSVELTREPSDQTSAIPLTRTLLDLRSRNFAAVRLSPRDGVRIPRGFGDRDNGPVTLVGEFLRPGVYDIRRGERLSEIIARAGGLTPQAYPYGAVFTRESARTRQQEGFNRTARELETGLMQVAAGQAVVGSNRATDINGAVAAGQQLANSLRNIPAAGRIVVEANPVVLAGRPELDVLLEPGDLIVMPKRPNEVTVVGAVQNPGSLQFLTGWRANQYVQASGGTQRFADPGRAFLVLPNGTSTPAGLGAWQQGGPPVPPGSLVIVPNDPSPFEAWGFLRDMTQVAGQLAISAAALAVISRGGN
ncbi:SLBB domain-containing protein [Sediminicoccus sp. KRV36]|uniref:polysaccharide biosynthesis/export family protein n=1 Tax=Sediminicoccus sp. KRV36 TaxID=3133721 RepID=UPI00200C7FD3|nr:SLBB domain-containing protein [Sediminicoccus rosea]UPY36175.1 SLBB domain-containing protein [Sediminicoccus rosea]